MPKERLRKGEKRQINWESLVDDLVVNCDLYHKYFYVKNNFNGPSHHFHIRALSASENDKSEMTYALLVSWGMHRMGGGAQMNDFEIFSDSINANLEHLRLMKSKYLENISETEFTQLKSIFLTLHPMKTSRKIVAVSKVLSHYLPNIVAPIDNEYTFRFICDEANPPRNWEEFELFKEIHLNLFKRVIAERRFKSFANQWLHNQDYPWDTSKLKIVDNLIIGKIGHLKQQEANKKKKMKNPA